MNARRNIQQVGSKFVVSLMKAGKRQRVTCATLEDALAVRARIETELAGQQADQWTLGHAYEVVLAQVWAHGRNVDMATLNGKAVVEFFGKDTLLDAISTEKVDGWISRLRQLGLAPATIKNKVSSLSTIMTFAMVRHKMRSRPHFARPSTKNNGRSRFLTLKEEDLLVEKMGARGKNCQAEAVKVLVDTGVRPSELWRLEAAHVNFEVGVISVWKNKSDKPRSVPITTRVREILEARMEFHPKGRLFPHTNAWMENAWNEVKDDMGLADDGEFVPYALRHTCASRLIQRGVNPVVVKNWLGHSSLTITDRYVHLNPQSMLDAVKVLERC